MKISLIAAATEDGVIGQNNQMPWHLPADFAWFKQCTLGKPIVMGRKTFESIGRPLPKRLNIVISRDPNFIVPDGVILVSDLDSAWRAADLVEEVMVIGGGSIYQACLPMADHLYLTEVMAPNVVGDTHFPTWDRSEWRLRESQIYEADLQNSYRMNFQIFDRL
jgi:dihydrofolate reductase